jgi:hypothetical protein
MHVLMIQSVSLHYEKLHKSQRIHKQIIGIQR